MTPALKRQVSVSKIRTVIVPCLLVFLVRSLCHEMPTGPLETIVEMAPETVVVEMAPETVVVEMAPETVVVLQISTDRI